MKNKFIILSIIFLLLIFIAGCNQSKEIQNSEKTINVNIVSTNYNDDKMLREAMLKIDNKDYTFKIDQSRIINDINITLINVGSTGAVLVIVDGDMSTINPQEQVIFPKIRQATIVINNIKIAYYKPEHHYYGHTWVYPEITVENIGELDIYPTLNISILLDGKRIYSPVLSIFTNQSDNPIDELKSKEKINGNLLLVEPPILEIDKDYTLHIELKHSQSNKTITSTNKNFRT